MLRQYGVELAKDASPERLPILVELGRKRTWSQPALPGFGWLYERMPDVLRQSLDPDGWDMLDGILKNGKGTILLDGLDELSPESQRGILELIPTLENNKILLTSRPHVYRLRPLRGFEVYEIQGLNETQFILLTERVSRALGTQFRVDYRDVMKKVLDVRRSGDSQLTSNPLLVSFMCLSATRRQKERNLDRFPTRPTELIGECIAALVEWHRKHKKPTMEWPDTLTPLRVRSILGSLALASFKNGTGVIQPSDIERLDDGARKAVTEQLVAARFLEQRHQDYAFPLETFREYFAAVAIAAADDPYSEVRSHLHSPEWQRIIVFVAGSLERDRAAKLDLMFPLLSKYCVKSFQLLLKVGTSIAGLATAKKPIVDTIVKEAFTELGSKQGALDRWLAGSRHSVEFFVTAILRHRCRLKRGRYERILRRDLRLAGRCLGIAVGCPPRLIRQVIEPLVETGPLYLHCGLSNSGHANLPAGRIVLLDLTRAADPYVRRNAADSLAPVASQPQVKQRLLDLTLDPEWLVRVGAVCALGKIGNDPEVQHRLLELTCDSQEAIRMHATDALAALWPVPQIQKRLRERARDGDVKSRRQTIYALRLAPRDVQLRSCLFECLLDADVRDAAANAIAAIADDPHVQDGLLALSRDTDASIRKLTVYPLSNGANRTEVKQRLLELTRDEELVVRVAAVKALRSIPSQGDVEERLLQLTHDNDWSVRQEAVEELSRLARATRVQQRLLEMTYDTEWRVRQAAAEGLTSFVDVPSIQQRLLELTHESEWIVRANAVEALTAVSNQPAVEKRILELTYDSEWVVQVNAAEALTRNAEDVVVQKRLLDMTNDEYSEIRKFATFALKLAAGEPNVRKRLIELTRDSDSEVRDGAIEALCLLGPPPLSVVRQEAQRISGRNPWVNTLENLVLAREYPRAR
jgi:HEAT repeat protein